MASPEGSRHLLWNTVWSCPCTSRKMPQSHYHPCAGMMGVGESCAPTPFQRLNIRSPLHLLSVFQTSSMAGLTLTFSPLCPKCLLLPSSWPTTPSLTPLLESMLYEHLSLHSYLTRRYPLLPAPRPRHAVFCVLSSRDAQLHPTLSHFHQLIQCLLSHYTMSSVAPSSIHHPRWSVGVRSIEWMNPAS